MQRQISQLCTVPIQSLKRSDYYFRDEAVASLMFELYILNENNGVATANLRLILGFKSSWLISRRLLQLKSLLINQIISFLTRNFSLAIMVETYLAWLD